MGFHLLSVHLNLSLITTLKKHSSLFYIKVFYFYFLSSLPIHISQYMGQQISQTNVCVKMKIPTCENSIWCGVFNACPHYNPINRSYHDVVLVGNNGSSTGMEVFGLSWWVWWSIHYHKNDISTHPSLEGKSWHQPADIYNYRVFLEEGSVYPLGENLIKQVSTSNCLGRGLWGNNFTTDEN